MNISSKISNIIFVAGNTVLGDVPHAIILSLIEEFHQIWTATPNLRHNIELSQYFAINKSLLNLNKSLTCEQCEIVLKYENTVCISESEFNSNKEKYYFVKNDKINFTIPGIKYGTINFFIKQSNENNNISYMKISVIKLVDDIQFDNKKLYWDNEEIKEIKKNADISICRSQTDTLNSIGNTGDFAITSTEKIPEVISLVNEIIDESKKALINAQINQIYYNKKFKNNIPNQQIINLANIVSNIIISEKKSTTVILIPDFRSVILSENTTSKCASILIDATIMIVATAKISPLMQLKEGLSITNITSNLSALILSSDIKNKIQIEEPVKAQTNDCTKYQSNNSFIINKIKSV